MIFFDIVTVAVLVWMIISGIKNGFISQLFSLLGIVAGVALAISYGEELALSLNMDELYASVAGFLIIFFTTTIVATILAKIVAKLLSAIGLGWANIVFGILFAMLKGLVVLSIFYAAIFDLNERFNVVDRAEFDKSTSFNVVRKVAQPLLEYWESTRPDTNTEIHEA